MHPEAEPHFLEPLFDLIDGLAARPPALSQLFLRQAHQLEKGADTQRLKGGLYTGGERQGRDPHLP